MRKSLGMAPMNCTNDLRGPPHEVGFRDSSVMGAGFQHIPKRATFSIIHNKIQVGGSLESAEEVWGPLRIGPNCLEQ